jgi:hypothetical protein
MEAQRFIHPFAGFNKKAGRRSDGTQAICGLKAKPALHSKG